MEVGGMPPPSLEGRRRAPLLSGNVVENVEVEYVPSCYFYETAQMLNGKMYSTSLSSRPNGGSDGHGFHR